MMALVLVALFSGHSVHKVDVQLKDCPATLTSVSLALDGNDSASSVTVKDFRAQGSVSPATIFIERKTMASLRLGGLRTFCRHVSLDSKGEALFVFSCDQSRPAADVTVQVEAKDLGEKYRRVLRAPKQCGPKAKVDQDCTCDEGLEFGEKATIHDVQLEGERVTVSFINKDGGVSSLDTRMFLLHKVKKLSGSEVNKAVRLQDVKGRRLFSPISIDVHTATLKLLKNVAVAVVDVR